MSRSVGRAIGLDVHRDFCEVAICEALTMDLLSGRAGVSAKYGLLGQTT